MCDDDNDIEMTGVVGRAFLPGVTAATMLAAAQVRTTRSHLGGPNKLASHARAMRTQQRRDTNQRALEHWG